MDWNALKVFLAIAETGTLAGAARQLEVNHSTVFRRLNAFEVAFGGRVFERLPQGYRLTSMGEELLLRAEKIADAFDDLDRSIVGKDFQPRGVVKITAPNNIAYHFLSRYLTDFNKTYPDIRFELLVSNLEFNMNDRRADIAVRATPSPPEHLVGRSISTISWGVYTSAKFRDEFGAPSELNQVGQYPLIGATGAMRKLPAFAWLEKHYGEHIVSRCDDITAMSCFAEAGRGLAFLPDDQRRPEIIRLFDFLPGKTSDLWILTHSELRKVERIKLVMQHLYVEFIKEKIYSIRN